MKALHSKLVELAYEVVNLNGQSKYIELSPGSDYQGELILAWVDHKFEAHLTIFSDPHTTGGYYYQPPETTWREESETILTSKIREVNELVESYHLSLKENV